MAGKPKVIICHLNSRGCWLWTGSCSQNGKGYPTSDKGHITRIMLAAKIGKPLPKTILALHDCDEKRCLNPEHLHEGSYSDNIKEAYARNRRKGRRKITQYCTIPGCHREHAAKGKCNNHYQKTYWQSYLRS